MLRFGDPRPHTVPTSPRGRTRSHEDQHYDLAVGPDFSLSQGSSTGGGKQQGGGGWLDAGGSGGVENLLGAAETKDQDTADADDGDPFGLGKIMANDKQKAPISDRYRVERRNEEEEEEEDPFGLGRIMAGDHKAEDSTGRESSRPSATVPTGQGRAKRVNNPEHSIGPAAGRARKAQKTALGGYFSESHMSSKARGDEISKRSTAVAEAARKVAFIRANSFKGARPGYMFQKGASGLGYYFDKVFSAREAREEMQRRAGEGEEESRSAARWEDAPGKVAAAKVGVARRPSVDVLAAGHKLEALLLKPKKAAKAASLMADLMDAEMRPENAAMFFRALRPLAEEPAGDAALASGEGAARAFCLLVDRGADWLSNPSDRVRVVTWGLLFGLRHDVKTDDSFQFARAVKRLREAIEALGDAAGGGDASDTISGGGEKMCAADEAASLPLERKRAIVLIMQETFKSYHLAWARSSIEPAFKAASDRRRLFPEGDLREALDGFTETITKRQRNPSGALAPPSRSVRALNSTAHPTLNKRSDVIR